jgi:hypothetical protein
MNLKPNKTRKQQPRALFISHYSPEAAKESLACLSAFVALSRTEAIEEEFQVDITTFLSTEVWLLVAVRIAVTCKQD